MEALRSRKTPTLRSRKAQGAREARRYRAVELSEMGWTQTAIAQALGVTQGAVSQWLKRAKEGGIEALRPKPVPGTPRKLKTGDLAKLPSLLEQGAEAFGFLGAVWTRKRVVTVIERVFGVRYTPQHVGHLLREIGYSRQKPQRKARQQDREAVETFRKETWPSLKRGR
jgi:transposase